MVLEGMSEKSIEARKQSIIQKKLTPLAEMTERSKFVMKRQTKTGRNMIMLLVAAFLFCVFLVSCAKNDNKPTEDHTIALNDCRIEHDEQYGGVYIRCPIEEFQKLGFDYGDSVNITFSNQYSMNDIPYHNGDYVDLGKPLLVGYTGHTDLEVHHYHGDDLWQIAALDDSMTVSVVLNKKGKYQEEQIINGLVYSNEQGDLPDEVFANFRAVNVGNLKENLVYRSSSPCDNQINRAAVVDKLCQEANIQYVINLADSKDDIEAYISQKDFNSPWYLELYQRDHVCALDMEININQEQLLHKLAEGFTQMAQNEGPYLIHCLEGKDRTGFVCMILEALTGASVDEIKQDYMVTYKNYYSITEQTDAELYSKIRSFNIDRMLTFLTNGEDVDPVKRDQLSEYAEKFLVSQGMNPADVQTLKDKLCR